MASIVWVAVFMLLIFEIAVTFLLVLPFPRRVRHFLAKKIFSYSLGERIRIIANFIFFALLLAIADAISSLRHISSKEENAEGSNSAYPEGQAAYISVSLDKQRKFRAERNMYLAGFALTLGFVITRLIELIQQLVQGEEEKEALQKRITAYENAAKSNRQTVDTSEVNDQEGTPMETIRNSIESEGLRRRLGTESESIASESTNAKTD